MSKRISDLPEYRVISGSMYVPVVDLNASASVRNKKMKIDELMKYYPVSSNSYINRTPGFGYFGDGSTGNGNFSSSVQISSSLNSSTDGNPIILNFKSLFISQSLLFSPISRCKGMLIFVDGDCTVSGTISMTAKGANTTPQDCRFYPINPPYMGYYWTDVIFPTAQYYSPVWDIGSNGGSAGPVNQKGANGSSAGTGYSGGGGAGGSNTTNTGSSGGYGISFSGGSGGGGRGSTAAGASTVNGGAGGAGGTGAGGGAGNPGGSPNGGQGTGGLLILIVKGNLYIGPSGSIQSNGSNGGSATSASCSGGGGSGGGIVYVYYANNLFSSSIRPAITVTGGIGGAGSGSGFNGGYGGTGSLVVKNLFNAFPIIY